MTRGLTPPSLPGELSSLKQRISDLERKLDSIGSAEQRLGLPFSLGGRIYVSESAPWTPPVKLRIATMVGILGIPGTTTTTVALKVNGLTVTSMSFASGERFKRLTLSKTLVPDVDLVTVAITAAGTAAASVDVIIRFA